jgi:hypothetical protein
LYSYTLEVESKVTPLIRDLKNKDLKMLIEQTETNIYMAEKNARISTDILHDKTSIIITGKKRSVEQAVKSIKTLINQKVR